MISYPLSKAGYDSQYIMFEDGTVFNTKTGFFLKVDRHNRITVKKNGVPCHRSIRPIYQALFDRYLQQEDTIINLENEQWAEIEGYKGCYLVSTKGRIKTYAKHAKARILEPFKKHDGYFYVDLWLNGERKESIAVHRLVARTFHPDYGEDKVTHHRDGQKLNNSLENLQCLSHEDHCRLHGELKKQESKTD